MKETNKAPQGLAQMTTEEQLAIRNAQRLIVLDEKSLADLVVQTLQKYGLAGTHNIDDRTLQFVPKA